MRGLHFLFAPITVSLVACALPEDAVDDGHHHDSEHEEATAPPPLVGRAAATAAADGRFHLAVLDIGQGDAAVVVAPGGCAALFDGGPTGSGAAIVDYLAARGATLSYAVVSHYHLDHIGGIDEVDDVVRIPTVYDRGGSYSSATYDAYAKRFRGRRDTVAAGDTLGLCGQVSLRVVAANANGLSTSSENARSVAVKISYGALDALVGGDLTGASPDVESRVAGSIGEIEVYKVHHHGSRYSSNATFLNATLPTVSFISVGANNTYNHPHPEALDRLAAVGSDVWQTADPDTGKRLGKIEASTSTGSTYDVAQGSRSVAYWAKGGGSTASATDTTAPSAPTSLGATAASATRVDLSWPAANDDVEMAGYRVYRAVDGGAATLLATITATGHVDDTTEASRTYDYQVSAVDAAGNESARSGAARVVTPCALTASWTYRKGTITVRAKTTAGPGAAIDAWADGAYAGTLTGQARSELHDLRRTWPSSPTCVTTIADCGGTAEVCK